MAHLGTVEDIHSEELQGCPIRPLGHNGGKYYFLDEVGQIREYGYKDFTYNGLVSLFGGKTDWMLDQYPRRGRKGQPIDGSFESDDVSQVLMRACIREGLFDSTIQQRGPGVWLKGVNEVDAQGLVVHCGDQLFIDNQSQAPGQKIGNAIYTRARKVEPLADRPASDKDGEKLLSLIKRWEFKRPELDPLLVTGFIAQAMLGGAPRWRAHMMVTGQQGSGKTFLANTVYSALGGAAHPTMNNFTQASLYQAFTGEARCLVLDENEPDEAHSRAMAVIELLRHMSSGEGAKVMRGSAGGQANDYSITGCAYLSSILQAQLKPQDASRITHIRLDALPDNTPAEGVAKLERDIDEIRKLSPAFRRRMVQMWPEFRARFEIYRAEFMALKMDSRAADQLATLFAGKDVILNTEMPSSDDLAADRTLAYEVIAEYRADRESENEGQQCLNHLLTSVTDYVRDGRKHTVGQMIDEAHQLMGDSGSVCQALAAYGVKYKKPRRGQSGFEEASIIIATNAQIVGLSRLYAGTRWQGGGWGQAIGDYYEGAQRTGKTIRFGGAVSKGIQIPIDRVVGGKDWDDDT